MKIGICDDEPCITKLLTALVEQSLEKLNVNAEILTFFSGYSLLEQVKELDAVFLDIEMPELDGYETGRWIKIKNPDCRIIMATGKVERFKESFKINAFRFVTKPFISSEIEEAIETLITLKIGEKAISLYLDRNPYEIPQKDIKYFKAFNGYSIAVVKDECFRKDSSLNELEKVLDKRIFVRINKQYLVNMRFVEIVKASALVIDGIEIPISRRKQKKLETAYINFDVNYRG